jgi:hypothetical protein
LVEDAKKLMAEKIIVPNRAVYCDKEGNYIELSVFIQNETWQSGHLYSRALNIKCQAYCSKGSKVLIGKRRVRERRNLLPTHFS